MKIKILESYIYLIPLITKKIDHEEVRANIILDLKSTLIAPNLVACGWDIVLSQGAKLFAPKLKVCGGKIAIGKKATFRAPKLKACGGGIYCHPSAKTRNLDKVKKYCSIRKYAGEYPPTPVAVVTNGINEFPIANPVGKLVPETYQYAGYSFANGILSKIIQQRGNIFKVRICGFRKTSYLFTDGKIKLWAHGARLKSARENLKRKIYNHTGEEIK